MRCVPVFVASVLLAIPLLRVGAEQRRDAVNALSAVPRAQAVVEELGARPVRVQREIAAREHQASRSDGGLQAPNRAHGLRTWFEPTGVRVHDRTGEGSLRLVELRLTGVGRGDGKPTAVAAGQVVAQGARVEIRRPGLVEWYVNAPAGLEQGFTLAERPRGEGPLVLELAVEGASAQIDGDAVALASAAGRRLRYGELAVRDAAGALQVARLEVPSASRVRIAVEDDRAVYPLVIDPLLTSEGFAATVLQSDQGDFGLSVAGAGDVNGDGYEDVIVGAPSYDAGEYHEGAAFVFFGSATGVADGDPSTAATVLESNQPDARLGTSVAGAGDVNGDGYDDVIVGAPSYEDEGDQGNEGAAFVFLGSTAGIPDGDPSTAATVLESDQGEARLYDVAGAGDVNGDGYDDVIVGAAGYDAGGQPDGGAAFVFLGSAAGIPDGDPHTAATELMSNQAHGQFGSPVAGAGDVDGDGYDDVIVGARGYDAGQTDEGAAFLFLGSADGVSDGVPATAAAQLESNQDGAVFGGVAGAGDVNGDGYGDVIVGSYGYDAGQANEGAAFVFLGGAAGIPDGDPSPAASVLEAKQGGAYLGANAAGAGDVDGDGYDDVIVGADGYDTGQPADEGAAFVFLGGAGGIPDGDPSTAASALLSNQAYTQFGSKVAGAGDLNGDGHDEVIVGVYDGGEYSQGAAFVFLGNTCGNQVDDDGDGFTDHPDDAGCSSVADLSERGVACDDGRDNDGDVRVDFPSDPGCADPVDPSERLGTACDDGLDNDGDTRVDFPSDPGCEDLADVSERGGAACDDGLDNDGDAGVDFPSDPGCESPVDPSEKSPGLVCDDGLDNDGDGRADFPADAGCEASDGSPENPACQDGRDNDRQAGLDFDGGASLDLDGDGFVDSTFNPAVPAVGELDPHCAGKPWRKSEAQSCGLGAELVLALALLGRSRRRSARTGPRR